MYIRIRKSFEKSNDIILNITKSASILEIKEKIEKTWTYPKEKQNLFYNGKKLINDLQIMDYDIRLNDVLLLHVCYEELLNSNTSLTLTSKNEVEEKQKVRKTNNCYLNVGDLVDVRCSCYAAWFEGVIISIKKDGNDGIDHNQNHLYMVHLDKKFQLDNSLIIVKMSDIRPKSFRELTFTDLQIADTIMINYNIEKPGHIGYWYDMQLKEINVSKKVLHGDLILTNSNIRIPNVYCVNYLGKIWHIEKFKQLNDDVDDEEIKSNETNDVDDDINCNYCEYCDNSVDGECNWCGCQKCKRKIEPDKILLCDECNNGYHIYCLDKPLDKIPNDDFWYCINCRNIPDAIVNTGKRNRNRKYDKIEIMEKKRNNNWGYGMACIGRTKECKIVGKNHFGAIPGIRVGTQWKFRFQVSEAGVHRPCVAGIHGSESNGAYSIVLSGGYAGDVDNGDEFIYSGSGGRLLGNQKRTSTTQTFDQTLTRMNKALAINCHCDFNNESGNEAVQWEFGKPVRVVRNYKLSKYSKYAPKEGNRYDGIYKVVKYFKDTKTTGFTVWRFLLRRDDPEPAPWTLNGYHSQMIYPDGYLEANNIKHIKSATATSSSFTLSSHIEKLIAADVGNRERWQQCSLMLPFGKETYLEKVRAEFTCFVCQELVRSAVTMPCFHYLCASCINQSFSANIHQCPACRTPFPSDFNIIANYNYHLDNILKQLFTI